MVHNTIGTSSQLQSEKTYPREFTQRNKSSTHTGIAQYANATQLSAAILVISVRLVLYELPCVKDEGRNNRDRAHYIQSKYKISMCLGLSQKYYTALTSMSAHRNKHGKSAPFVILSLYLPPPRHIIQFAFLIINVLAYFVEAHIFQLFQETIIIGTAITIILDLLVNVSLAIVVSNGATIRRVPELAFVGVAETSPSVIIAVTLGDIASRICSNFAAIVNINNKIRSRTRRVVLFHRFIHPCSCPLHL